MLRWLLLILFTISCCTISSNTLGQKKADSLLNILKYSKYDTNMVNTLARLCEEYRTSNPDTALIYGQQGLLLAQKIGFVKGIAKCYKIVSLIYFTQDNYQKALESDLNALEIYEGLGKKKAIYECYNEIGVIYCNQGNSLKALEYYLKSLKICEELRDKNGISDVYNNIGIIYDLQGSYSKALEYYLKTLKIYEEINDEEGKSGAYMNIGNIMDSQGRYSEALECYQKSVKICEQLGDSIGMADCYMNIGIINNEKGEYSKASEYFQKSLKLYKNLNIKGGIAGCDNSLAELNVNIHNYEQAMIYAEEALIVAKEIESLSSKQDVYHILSVIYDSLGNFEEALGYYKLYSETKDSLLNQENQKKIIEMESKYQGEKKEKEITILNEQAKTQELFIEKEQNRKRNQLFIFSACLIVIILTFIIFYTRYKSMQKAAMALAIAEQQKLRFKEVIEAQENERKRIAEDLHDSVGLMLATAKFNLTEVEDVAEFKDDEDSAILKNTINLIDDSSQEVRNISHNMMPGTLIELGLVSALKELTAKINIAHKINADLLVNDGFDNRLDETIEITTYRIIQEILGNIIKHASATQVNIELAKTNTEIILSIKDNGVGFEKSKIERSSGIGWKNIYSRVTMLNGAINIKSEKGTEIKIRFPVEG